MDRRSIVIVGAGPVGVNTALTFERLIALGKRDPAIGARLARLRIDDAQVVLVEKGAEIYQGAAPNSYIWHEGYEYFMPGHQATGIACIDGLLTTMQLYPFKDFMTRICTPETPIRFCVSTPAATREKDRIPREGFNEYAEYIRRHFALRYVEIADLLGRDEALLRKLIPINLLRFSHELKEGEYTDLKNIAFGQAGAASGINMPHVYAYTRKALELAEARGNLRVLYNTTIVSQEKVVDGGDRQYIIRLSNGEVLKSSDIAHVAGIGNPDLRDRIVNADRNPEIEGTYFWNAMLSVNLPPTNDAALRQMAGRANFTLRDQDGCAFTGVVPPMSPDEAETLKRAMDDRGLGWYPRWGMGQAVIYAPWTTGNQIESYTVGKGIHETGLKLSEWESLLADGPADRRGRVRNILEQAARFYPFIRNYVEVDEERPLRYGGVFNVATRDSAYGTIRHVREMTDAYEVTADGNILSANTPKLTNAALVAEGMTHRLLQNMERRVRIEEGQDPGNKKDLPGLGACLGIPGTDNGYGPADLNMALIASRLNFRELRDRGGYIVRPDPEDAIRFAVEAGIHPSIVDFGAEIFTGIAREEVLSTEDVQREWGSIIQERRASRDRAPGERLI